MEDSIKQVAERALELEMYSIVSYEKFIKKAEEEGYKNVAKLLRGLLEAEKIHFKKIFLVYVGHEPSDEEIREYKNRIEVNVGNTIENLIQCRNKEREIWDQIYPEFINMVENSNPILAMVLKETMDASKEHEKLIENALNVVNNGGDIVIGGGVYYCPTCGLVMVGDPPFRCPICNEVKSNFVRIE